MSVIGDGTINNPSFEFIALFLVPCVVLLRNRWPTVSWILCLLPTKGSLSPRLSRWSTRDDAFAGQVKIVDLLSYKEMMRWDFSSGGSHNKFNRNPQWNTLNHCPPDLISESFSAPLVQWRPLARVCACVNETLPLWYQINSLCICLSVSLPLPGLLLFSYLAITFWLNTHLCPLSVCACVVNECLISRMGHSEASAKV